jgi:predicted nuclease of predicted toxin-antitoxin system
MLINEGHECWTAYQAGLAAEPQDDNLTVYADNKDAVLVTIDKDFSERRCKNTIGHNVWLRCPEPEAAELLRSNLSEVLSYLARSDVIIIVSSSGVHAETSWG